MARLAGLALEPLEGTCGAGGITVKRPCYLFPSVIGKAHNREEGGFVARPTCVGKTRRVRVRWRSCWKHPHVCGEDKAHKYSIENEKETPPHA